MATTTPSYFVMAPPFGGCPSFAIPDSGFGVSANGFVGCSIMRLPTDSIGFHALTLENMIVGSRINIRDQAGTTTLYDDLAATATVAISLSVYGAGSPLNAWRIKVRNASGTPAYIPYETLMTAYVGSSSLYVSQIPDE